MIVPNPEYSVWLLPAAAQERSLAETITRLSVALGGERFAPHVTIQGDLCRPLDSLAVSLAALAARVPVQRWCVQQVERSNHFFRCLYLRFGQEPAFDFLQGEVQAISRTAEGLSPYPHLSLAYGNDYPGIGSLRTSLANEFDSLEIAFDRLAISLSSKVLPIAEWQCLAEYALSMP